MKFKRIPLIALIFGVAVVGLGAAEQKRSLSDNAALRYYAAFTVMQDAVISDAEARKLNRILEGTAPYDDSQYSALVEKNDDALRLLQLGASHPECDWGLDYQLGEQTPVEYARNALQLGRLTGREMGVPARTHDIRHEQSDQDHRPNRRTHQESFLSQKEHRSGN